MIIGENTGADMQAQGVATNGTSREIRAGNALARARYRKEPGIAYLTGIQALARLPLDQRRLDDCADLDSAGFISGYRGSPLGGLDQELWRLSDALKAHRVVFQPGVNEDLAATAVWGSQQVGLFPGARREGVYGLWYGKAPGLDRSSDAVRHANAAGTSPRGGVLLVVGDDHACKSSTLPSASEFALRDLGVPVLAPADVQDVLDFGLAGWAMSRYAGCWTGLIALTDIMDSALTVDIDLDRHRFENPPHEEPFPHIRLQDSPADQESRLETKLRLARMFASANSIDRIVTTVPSPRLVLVTGGKTYADVREALARLGLQSEAQLVRAGVRLVKLGMTWPLDTALVDEFCRGARRLMVIEEKRPFIEDQLRTILFGRPVELLGKAYGGQPANLDDARDGLSGFRGTNVFGWTLRPARAVAGSTGGTRLLPAAGQLDVADIARAIADALPGVTDHGYLGEVTAAAGTLPADAKHSKHMRKPMYCAGCPHNTSTRVPEGSRAAAGIGCHYMAQWMDRNTGTVTHMGAEGVNWIGQAPFTDESHIFANIGDGTYFHSGILAIRAAVAAGVNITYKVLANDAVAMTGGQPVDGSLTVEDIVAQVRAEGVAAVRVVSDDPRRHRRAGFRVAPRDALDTVQRELKEIPGCTVLVYEQTCAAELRRRRRRGLAADPDIRVVINDAVCEGCGDCSTQSNCVAVEPLDTEFGVKRAINQTACNKDLSCIDGFCPALVTLAGARPRVTAGPNDARPLVPLPPGSGSAANILIAGVGGTGIVTVSQVLGTAAHLDGSHVSTLDMTGLAQKGGAVVSHVRISPAGVSQPPSAYANPDSVRGPVDRSRRGHGGRRGRASPRIGEEDQCHPQHSPRTHCGIRAPPASGVRHRPASGPVAEARETPGHGGCECRDRDDVRLKRLRQHLPAWLRLSDGRHSGVDAVPAAGDYAERRRRRAEPVGISARSRGGPRSRDVASRTGGPPAAAQPRDAATAVVEPGRSHRRATRVSDRIPGRGAREPVRESGQPDSRAGDTRQAGQPRLDRGGRRKLLQAALNQGRIRGGATLHPSSSRRGP